MRASYYYLSNYKNYANDACRSEIQNFCSLNETDSGLFMEAIFYICNKHAPVRKKIPSYKRMIKELQNAIMKTSRYRNKLLNSKRQTSREIYKSQ